MKFPNVGVTVGDQCQYGLVTPSAEHPEESMPAKKRTRFMSPSRFMLKRLSRVCPGDHDHQPLIGGRAAEAAFYPLPLVVEILRGMRDTADHEHQDDNDVNLQSMHQIMAEHDEAVTRTCELSMAAIASKEEIEAANRQATSWIRLKNKPNE